MFFMCTHKQQLIPMRFLSSAKIVYIRITIDNIGGGSERQTQKSVFLFCSALAFHYIYIIQEGLGKTNSKKVFFCFAVHSPFTIFT